MEKSPDAFRTISEVAKDIDVPQHVLRFWETKFSSIKPMKRAGGRRYYRPSDLKLLHGIRNLLYGEGYTIKGVQRILRERGAAYVIEAGRSEKLSISEATGKPAPARGASQPPMQSAPPLQPGSICEADRQALVTALEELGEVKDMLVTGKL